MTTQTTPSHKVIPVYLDELNPNDLVQTKRGDGTTTKQVKASPIGAYYVTPNTDYTRHLAHDLDRGDLKMQGLDFFDSYRWRGIKKSMIVIDHASPHLMNNRQYLAMCEALQVMHD